MTAKIRYIEPRLHEFTPVGLSPEHFVYRFLRDSNGSRDMDVDCTTPVIFKYPCPQNQAFHLYRLIVNIEDSGSKPNDFGGITGPLTNGIDLRVKNKHDDTLLDFNDGFPIPTNGRFGLLAGGDMDIKDAQGGADDSILVRFTIERAGTAMILLEGDYVSCVVQDDISELTAMHMKVQGLLFDVA